MLVYNGRNGVLFDIVRWTMLAVRTLSTDCTQCQTTSNVAQDVRTTKTRTSTKRYEKSATRAATAHELQLLLLMFLLR